MSMRHPTVPCQPQNTGAHTISQEEMVGDGTVQNLEHTRTTGRQA